jgi:hypothetical protein
MQRHTPFSHWILFGYSPISWKSKKQCTVDKSSSEAEYRAMVAVASEITLLVRLLEDFGVTELRLVTLECDNKSAIQMAHNLVFHHKTKHIAIDCHFTREKIIEGLIELKYIPPDEQISNALTKYFLLITYSTSYPSLA